MRVGIGVEDQYPNGFNEVDGVPVADVIGSALKMAEVLASLKKGGSSWVSRKCTFARPTQLAIDNARMVTDDIKLKPGETITDETLDELTGGKGDDNE